MAYGQEARHCVKDEEIKAKVTRSTKERVKIAAAEDGLQAGTWMRELVEHTLTMREIERRLKSHNLQL